MQYFNHNSIFKISLLLATFSLFASAAGQGGGYYLFLIVIPSLQFVTGNQTHYISTLLLRLGILCILICLIFSFANFYNSYLELPQLALPMATRPQLKFLTMLQSQLPSAVFFSGCVFIGWSFIRNRNRRAANFDLQGAYEKAFLLASAILLTYVFIQVLTGYDYRSYAAFRPDHQYPNGLYRAQGFYSHPLALAGASLAIFGYFLWLALKENTRRFARLTISILHFLIILASGGRFAFVIATISLVLFVVLFARSIFKKIHKIYYFAGMLVFTTLVFLSGISNRFVELFQRSDERLIFWKIYWQMFLDRIWFGHGQAWISVYRENYYNNLGFQSLERKYHAHNIYLQTLANVGVIGTFVVCLLFFGMLSVTKKLFIKQPQIWNALVFSLFLNFCNGFTQNTFFDPAVVYVYLHFLTLGLLVAITRKL